MASKAVADAILAYLAAHWTATPILSEDAEETPADGSAYVEAQFYPGHNERMTIDRKLIRERGELRIVVAVPRGAGASDAVRTHGDALSSLFCGLEIPATDAAAIHFGAPSDPVTDDRAKDGNYLVGAFVVDFWHVVDRG